MSLLSAVTTTPKGRDKALYPPPRLGKTYNRLKLLRTAYSAFSTQRKCPKFRSSTYIGPALFGLRKAALYPHPYDSCSHMGSASVLGHFSSSLVLPGTFQSTTANSICCSEDVLHLCCATRGYLHWCVRVEQGHCISNLTLDSDPGPGAVGSYW